MRFASVVVSDEIGIPTSPQDQQQQHPVSPPDGVVVRLRHTFSLGLADRLKSVGSPPDELSMFKLLPSPYTPDVGRKRFSISSAKRSSISTMKLSSSSLNSPTESLSAAVESESPAIFVMTPSDGPQQQNPFDYGVLSPVDARCRSLQDDANSLHSGQNARKRTKEKSNNERRLKNTFCVTMASCQMDCTLRREK